MVGVPGKFKGCETCRLRRVKCDNTRPLCNKCQDTGRECAGYERETVFIVGTVQDGGRCLSHPPRVIKPKRGSGSGSASGGSSAGSSSRNSGTGSRSSADPRSASASASTPSSSGASSPSVSTGDNYYPTTLYGDVSPANFESYPMSSPRAGGLHVSGGGLDLVAIRPLQSAWNDTLPVASGGFVYQVQISTLSIRLGALIRQPDNNETDGGRASFVLTPFPAYSPAGFRSPSARAEGFRLSAQCVVHLASGGTPGGFAQGPTDSICLFLYEHNSPLYSTTLLPAWEEPNLSNLPPLDNVRQSGPSQFVEFPAHHFFVRVYRPSAIWDALVNRRVTFLAEPEWTLLPWDAHPKSGLDRLLDIACLVPEILARFDSVSADEPTMARRMLMQDLLANCLYIEHLLEQWHTSMQEMGAGSGGASVTNDVTSMSSTSANVFCAEGAAGAHSNTLDARNTITTGGSISWYWIADPDSSAAQIPFADTFAFCDSTAALMFVYFWSVLILLYPCIESLHAAVLEPVLDVFPPPYPQSMPSSMAISNTTQYSVKEVRELAANVCRSLDYTLSTTVQPDLLTAPLLVVESFYHQINAESGDSGLELLWCEGFHGRLTAKGQYIAEVVQARGWTDTAQF